MPASEGESDLLLASGQLEDVRDLVSILLERNPFYRHKFNQAGIDAPPSALKEFTTRFPFTTKAELVLDQQAHPPYGTNLTFPLESYTRCHQTSGTTGSPLRWLDTADTWECMVRDWIIVLAKAGIGRADRILFAFSFGPFLGFWLAFEAGQRIGALCFAGGGMSSVTRLRVLLENRCTILCCTPTYALHLANIARNEGMDLTRSHVRTLVVAGEPGGSLPAYRKRLQEAWNGANVFDHHGMTEVGPVTHQRPGAPGHLVVLERSFFAEIIDPSTTKPVPEGGEGELVLTTLRRIGSPVVRYRTGDLVRARIPRSAEGQADFLELDGGILGRVDDMIIVRGVNIYPSAIEQIVQSCNGIVEYRVTWDASKEMVELSFEVEASPEAAVELHRRLEHGLGIRVNVTQVPVGTLPRFEFKAQRWRRLGIAS